MRLLLVELTRFRVRRAVAVVFAVAALLVGALVAAVVWETRPAGAGDRSAAQQIYEDELARCQQRPREYFGPGGTPQQCAVDGPQLEWFLDRPTLSIEEEEGGRGVAAVLLLVGAAALAGTTFAGADWNSGSMSTQLLFVPRRSTVWLAKAVAVVVGATLLAAVALAAFWAVLAAVAAARDLSPPEAVWRSVAGSAGRGLVLVAAVGLGSYALTMLLRSTVATLGLLFGYAVVGEALVYSLPFERMSQWSIAQNVAAWVRDGVEVYDESLCPEPVFEGPSCDPTYLLTLGHAAAYLGVMLLVAVVASVIAFRHRDVA